MYQLKENSVISVTIVSKANEYGNPSGQAWVTIGDEAFRIGLLPDDELISLRNVDEVVRGCVLMAKALGVPIHIEDYTKKIRGMCKDCDYKGFVSDLQYYCYVTKSDKCPAVQ